MVWHTRKAMSADWRPPRTNVRRRKSRREKRSKSNIVFLLIISNLQNMNCIFCHVICMCTSS
jgi:hypothetical protein